MNDEPMTLAETAGITAILSHVAGILAALPIDRFEVTMQGRYREMVARGEEEAAAEYTELTRAREERVAELRHAASHARKLVGSIEAAHGHWQEAVKLTTMAAQPSEPIAFDAEGMPAEGGHLVTLPSGKVVFQLDDDGPGIQGGVVVGNPTVVEPGGQVLYPKFGRLTGVPDASA